MEKNINIIKEEITPSTEDLYQKYILETISNLKKNENINISAKLLHYSNNPSFYYYCKVFQNTKINPFKDDILFCFEFINGEIPYVTILTDFFEPTLNDNRNYYRCLTKHHNYIFYLDKYKEQQAILESMINGIENFLYYLYESKEINTFIFFGEYEYEHIYQINDFLQNKNYLNFYRIYRIFGKNQEEERYIFFTKLYFLLFEPMKNDKTLLKLVFYKKLKDIKLAFDKNEIKDSLIIKFTYTDIIKDNSDKLELTIIDRKRKIIKDNEEKEKGEKEKEEKKDIKKNEIKQKEKYNYSIIIKEWLDYLDNIDFKKYENIASIYQMIFNEYRGNLKINDEEQNTIEEYNKLIQFYEKIVIYYENKKEKNNERVHKIIGNIIYICSELINNSKTENKNENEYLLKAKKYLNFYK